MSDNIVLTPLTCNDLLRNKNGIVGSLLFNIKHRKSLWEHAQPRCKFLYLFMPGESRQRTCLLNDIKMKIRLLSALSLEELKLNVLF